MKHYVRAYLSCLCALIVCHLSTKVAANMDVVFLLDTTGSMSSEIREVKDRVFQLASALKVERKGETVRLGIVAYRDKGDDYVTKISPLSEDIKKSERFLATLEADGGGDAPEDILSGLQVTLEKIAWSKGENIEKQVFLIGDAPPHLDYAKGPKVEGLISRARNNKVVLNAIGCRSLSSEGISFFKKLAYATEGRYQHIGRVKNGDPGLAEAMLSTLVPQKQKMELSHAKPVHINKEGDVAPPLHDVVIVQHDLSKSKNNSTCRVTVSVPTGLMLAKDPAVVNHENTLVFTLDMTSGTGESLVYNLPSCALAQKPIHVMIGGAK